MRGRQFGDMSGPDWVMVHQTSGRKDFRLYALLAFGLVFAFAGATIDPATNCDESGACAPWLVPVAFWMGVLATVAGLAAVYGLGRLLFRARHGEALVGLFAFVVVALVVLTIVGVFFRGANMALALPF